LGHEIAMGHGLCVECKNCDYGESFMLGVGMQYESLMNLISCLKGVTRNKVVDILENHNVMDGEFEHRLYACPNCNTLHERFYVHLDYDDGKVFEVAFRCGKCRTPLEVVDENVLALERYACKSCGKRELERGVEMLWD